MMKVIAKIKLRMIAKT